MWCRKPLTLRNVLALVLVVLVYPLVLVVDLLGVQVTINNSGADPEQFLLSNGTRTLSFSVPPHSFSSVDLPAGQYGWSTQSVAESWGWTTSEMEEGRRYYLGKNGVDVGWPELIDIGAAVPAAVSLDAPADWEDAFMAGLGLASTIMLFRAGLRWFRRVGSTGGGSNLET